MTRKLLLASLLLLLLLSVDRTETLAQSKTLIWERYDVNLTVLPNSDILVEEIQEITFTSGTFTFGFAAIPLDRTENLTDIRIFEQQGDRLREYTESFSNNPYTFETFVEENEQIIRWYFPPTNNSTHTYELHYRVQGGLRIYEEGDMLLWKAIPPDHNFPIRSARVRAVLPATFDPAELTINHFGAPANAFPDGDGSVVFTATDIPADQELEVLVAFPHGIVEGSPPAWQAADDRRRQLGPVFDLGFIVLGIIILFGGPLAVYALWYTRGRDEPVGLVADTLSEPPGELRPGVAGTLLDEQADLKDILATLIDLARRGAIHIEEKTDPGFLGIGSGREFIFHLQDESVADRPYEKKLLARIFSGGKTERSMSDLRNKFYRTIPDLKAALYDEVVAHQYFSGSPESVRQVYRLLGLAGLAVAGIVWFLVSLLTAEFSSLGFCLIVPLGITAASMFFVGRHMPRKTRLGAEEAAKWAAFRKYLRNIKQYGDLEEAKDRFELYLPYAIAFGIDKSLIQQFSQVETPAPHWYGPYFPGRRGHLGPVIGSGAGASVARSAPGPLAGEGGTPTLSEMSGNIGTSLSSMSSGLSSMLNSASSTFTSAPSSSGSGGGGFGGGGFSGGGGGGGSRGFG